MTRLVHFLLLLFGFAVLRHKLNRTRKRDGTGNVLAEAFHSLVRKRTLEKNPSKPFVNTVQQELIQFN